MTLLRPFATAFLIVLALQLVAGYTHGSQQSLAATSSGGPSGSPLITAAAAPQLGPGTASGSVSTTGAINDTWRWHPGLAVECSPVSVTVRPDRSPQSVGRVSVSIGPQDKLVVGLAGQAVPGGGMSGEARDKAQVGTRDWLMDSGNVKIGGTGIGDVGHIVIDHVMLASPNNSAKVVIKGELWLRCK